MGRSRRSVQGFLRLPANVSLIGPIHCAKLSCKLKFNFQNKTQRFHGLKSTCNFQDMDASLPTDMDAHGGAVGRRPAWDAPVCGPEPKEGCTTCDA